MHNRYPAGSNDSFGRMNRPHPMNTIHSSHPGLFRGGIVL